MTIITKNEMTIEAVCLLIDIKLKGKFWKLGKEMGERAGEGAKFLN